MRKKGKVINLDKEREVRFGSRYGYVVAVPEPVLQSRVRTLADMTDAEKRAIEERYHAKIKVDS